MAWASLVLWKGIMLSMCQIRCLVLILRRSPLGQVKGLNSSFIILAHPPQPPPIHSRQMPIHHPIPCFLSSLPLLVPSWGYVFRPPLPLPENLLDGRKMEETCGFSSESRGIYDAMVIWLWRIKIQLMLLEALWETGKIIARQGPVL